jgi:3-methyladenine DNA glycosylase AlkD
MTLYTAGEITAKMLSMRNDAQRKVSMCFFKTGHGEYGEGDQFLGIRVPAIRKVVKMVYKFFPLDGVEELLNSPWHEIRMCGLLILVDLFSRVANHSGEEAMKRRDDIVTFYLHHTERINNWDLVDSSAPDILGQWLMENTALGDPHDMLDALARSTDLWCRRISMVCTLTPIRHGDPSWCLRYAEIHLHDDQDFMQKAVGWMLREMGKWVSTDLLRSFLKQHAREMPRTMLRYSIERLDAAERKRLMAKR